MVPSKRYLKHLSKTTMINEVKTLNDEAVFAKEIIAEGVVIHPDDEYAAIVNAETEQPTYTAAEAELRISLLSQCFEVCEQYKDST